MKTITMLEFRQNAPAIIRDLQSGQEMTLTYRGRSVGRIVPVSNEGDKVAQEGGDIWGRLLAISSDAAPEGQVPLTNEEIDRLVYGI